MPRREFAAQASGREVFVLDARGAAGVLDGGGPARLRHVASALYVGRGEHLEGAWTATLDKAGLSSDLELAVHGGDAGPAGADDHVTFAHAASGLLLGDAGGPECDEVCPAEFAASAGVAATLQVGAVDAVSVADARKVAQLKDDAAAYRSAERRSFTRRFR